MLINPEVIYEASELLEVYNELLAFEAEANRVDFGSNSEHTLRFELIEGNPAEGEVTSSVDGIPMRFTQYIVKRAIVLLRERLEALHVDVSKLPELIPGDKT